MEYITTDIPLDCSIFDAGDFHVGPHGCDMKGIKSLVDEINRRDDARIILKGDLIDSISTDDKRFSPASYDIKDRWRNIDDHVDWLIETLRPIREKIVCIQTGNHEVSILKQTDVTKRICNALDVPYGGYYAIVTFTNAARHRHLFRFFVTHGRRSLNSHAKDPIQSKANMMASLKKNLGNLKIYDCIYQSQAHAHKLMAVPPTVTEEVMLKMKGGKVHQSYKSSVRQNADEISPESRWYGCSGSFLKTFSEPGRLSYAELSQFGPVEIGCLEPIVRAGELIEVRKRLY